MRCKDIIAFDRILTLAVAAFAAVAIFATSALAGDVVATGAWEKKSFNASGTWTVEQDGDTLTVTLSDDFRTRRAPDLKLFFSPLSVGALDGDNATDGSVLIAELDSNRGGQTYTISGVDLSDYQTIIIHCEAYSKLWSAAAL
ncbi:MAG: DM13 domain-containing protein [Pseudomonadota bacterium]